MGKKINTYLYGITLFFITLSGIAQMPIFKRYYIADIPGLGWLANFYATHLMHYIFAGIFLALVVYTVLNGIFFEKNTGRIAPQRVIKGVIFAGLILTGILMVFKNFPGTPFPNAFIITLNLLHILFCMALLVFGGYRLMTKKKALAG